MTDIFAKEGIQVNDINPPSPVLNSLDASGAPAEKPSGRIDDMAIAKELGGMGDYKPADAPSKLPPALPAPDAPPVQQAADEQQQANPAPDASAEPAPAPRDLFAEQGIAPEPSITEQNTQAINGGLNLTDPQTPEAQKAAAYVDHQMSQDEIIARSRFTPEQIASFKNNPITFSDVGKFLNANNTLPGGGVWKGVEAWETLKAAKKLQAGEELSVEEESVLYKNVDAQLEQNLRGFSIGGKIAYIGAQIPAFVTEFVASGGVGKSAQVATVEAAEKLAMKGVMVKVAGGVANTLARTSVMFPQYVGKFGEMRVNDAFGITDKGEAVLKTSEETPAVSALKAFGYTAADVAGQIAAPAFGQYILNPLTKAVKTPLISAVSQLSPEIRTAFYTAFKAIQPNAQMSKVFTSAGWNGMLEQLGANRVSEILHATIDASTDKDYSWHDYLSAITPSPDQLLVEGGLIALVGGIHTATNITANLLESRGIPKMQARETAENMSANEKEQFVQANLPTPKSDYVPATDANGEPVVSERPLSSDTPSHPEGELAAGQTAAAGKADPPPIINDESAFNISYRALFNGLDPIQKLPDLARERGAEIPAIKDTKLLSTIYSQNIEMIRQQLQVGTSVWDEAGNKVMTGKSLKAIMDDFDNTFISKEPSQKQREQDFHDYLTSTRYLLDLKDNPNVEVSDMKAQESADNLKRLADKYGEDYKMIAPLAQEIYDFQGRILDNLVSSGVMSEATRAKIGDMHKHYVPLQKVIDEEFPEGLSSKGTFTDARMSKVIKRIKGSDLEDKNVFHSIIKNTAKVIDLAARNNVAKSVADLGEYLPEYIQKTNAAIVKKGVAEVKVTYDPKLRAKLESTIKIFGDELKRSASPNVKGYKNVLGYYSPMEKLVMMKIGASEGVMSHEVGHMLDYKLGLKKKMLTDPVIKKQLQKLAEDRLVGDIKLVQGEEGLRFREELKKEGVSQKYLDYIKNDDEILANFFDAYVNTPEALETIAPKALKAFEKIIADNPDIAFLQDVKPSTSRQQETVSKNVYGEAEYAPPDTITVYRGGEKEYYKVSKPILEAMTQLSPAKINIVAKILLYPFKASANLLRFGATFTPEFIARNILRDQHDAFLQSGVKYNPADFAKGVFAAMGKTELYNQWAASGGKYNSYMQLDDEGLAKAYRELFKPSGKIARYIRNPLNIVHDTAQATEQGTRIGVFMKAKEQGLSDIEAAVASLEGTINFARKGSVGGVLNQYIPFLNAGLQASDKLVRTFKDNPKALTFWGVSTITVPSMVLTGFYLYGADDKTRKEYLEIPQWQKDMFWCVKVGDEWRRYPKPFTYGYIFGSVPERIMMWMYDGNKPKGEEAWLGIVKGMAGSVSPVNDISSVMPPLLKMAVEDATNHNFFTGRSIYPDWMEKLPPEARANKYTSDTAKEIGKAAGVSPAMIESSGQALLGNTSKYAFDAGDKILDSVKKFNGEDVPEKPITDSDRVLIKAFTVRHPAGYGSNSGVEFFKNFDKVSQMHTQFNDLDGKDQAAYGHANQKELAQYAALNAAYKEMKGLQKQIDGVYEHKTMKSDEKVKRINALEDQITNIARSANMKYSKSTGDK